MRYVLSGPGEGIRSGKQLVEDQASGKNIGAAVNRQLLQLLRRLVVWAFIPKSCQTKIDNPELAVAGQEKIRWLDFAMNNAQLVGIIQGVKKLLGEVDGVGRRDPESLLQMPTIGVLQHYIKETSLFPVSIDSHDAGVFQRACGADLAPELREASGTLQDFFRNRL